MISIFKLLFFTLTGYTIMLLLLMIFAGCVSTKVYKRDIKDLEVILWSYHNRLLDVELEQIRNILEERLHRFDKNQFKESEETNEND